MDVFQPSDVTDAVDIDSGDLGTGDVDTWGRAVLMAQQQLDRAVSAVAADMANNAENTESLLFRTLAEIDDEVSGLSFQVVWVNELNRERLLTVPLRYITESAMTLQSDLQSDLDALVETVTGVLPNPSEEDIRALVRSAILNTDQIQEMNRIFFEQFGSVSDLVDDVSTQLIHQINTLIRETIASVNQGLQEQLDSLTADIGSGWGVASAGIDGYAIVSQHEIERIHLEAEFTFAGEPDPRPTMQPWISPPGTAAMAVAAVRRMAAPVMWMWCFPPMMCPLICWAWMWG